MDEGSLSSFITLALLLGGNVLLTLGYSALVNARETYLAEQAEAGRKSAFLALELGEDATHLLTSYQLSMIVLRFWAAGVAAVSLAPPFAESFGLLGMDDLSALRLAQGTALLLCAAIMLILGEQVPAAVGAARADRLAPFVARPMRLLVRALTPVSWVLRRISAALVGLLGGENPVHYITEEEIKTLVDAGQEEGVLESQEKDMILSIFRLGETAVREVMVPRLDVVGLDIDTPLAEAVQTVIKVGHSRIPVYEENIDRIRGLLYAKDLLHLWGQGGNGNALRSLLREAYFVPESKSAMDLLEDLQRRRVHLAIVVDEYGGTAGLVTLEDLIEEIIGEIQDEYDLDEEAAYRQINDNEYVCNALLDLDDLNDLMGIHLPTDQGDTLGGFIFNEVGEVPKPGRVIETGEARLEVLTVDGRRIGEVRVTRLNIKPATDEPNGKNSA